MNSTEKQMKGSPRNAGRQRAGLVAMVCIVAAGWLAYFAITRLVLPASQVADEKGRIAGVEKSYASELAKLKAEEELVRQQEQQSLAAEKAAIQALRQRDADFSRNIRQQRQRYLDKEAAEMDLLRRKSANVTEALEKMARFARGLPNCLKLEDLAASRLAMVLREDAQLDTKSEPLVHTVLAGNFTLKHTGAKALATALSREAGVLARAAGTVSAMSVPSLGDKALPDALRAVGSADAALRAALAKSVEVRATVRGKMVLTGFDGTPNPLAGVRVTLIPREVNMHHIIPVLTALKVDLEKGLARVHTATVWFRKQTGYTAFGPPTIGVMSKRGGVVLGHLTEQEVATLGVDIDRRLNRLQKFLAKPPGKIDARRAFLVFWNCGNPLLYPSGASFPLKYSFPHPAAAMFLPWGVTGWLERYVTSPSVLTHGDGSFCVRNVRAGAYYAFAFHAAQPFEAWMIPVMVPSRQTVHINLDNTNPLEIAN